MFSVKETVKNQRNIGTMFCFRYFLKLLHPINSNQLTQVTVETTRKMKAVTSRFTRDQWNVPLLSQRNRQKQMSQT